MRRYRQPEMLLLDFAAANQADKNQAGAPMIVSRAAA
jgi:hypothetical protein